MTRTVLLREEHKLEFNYDLRNHIWIYIQLSFLDIKGKEKCFLDKNHRFRNFIFDTGAQNTIISKRRSIECGYINLPVQERIVAGGIGGGIIHCNRIEIPDMIVTNDLIIQRPSILIPEDANVNVNILGQDLLKPYSYYLDAKNKCIYFDLDL